MDHTTPMSWPEPLGDEHFMSAPADNDFSNFLEFGVGFADIDSEQQQLHNQHQVASTLPRTTAEQDFVQHMETDPTSQPPNYGHLMGDMSVDLHNQTQQPQFQTRMHTPYSNPSMTPSFFAPDHRHQQPQQQPQQHQMHQHQQLHMQPQHQQQHNQVSCPTPTTQQYAQGQTMIPPTPNSMELHGAASRFSQRVEDSHDMYDSYTRINDEQALYTPLMSPAMTPLETQFRLHDFAIPGEYFTPLTSPALEAQNAHAQTNNRAQNHHLASGSNGFHFSGQGVDPASFVQSPFDITSNVAPTSAPPPTSAPSSPGLLRRNRRRPSTNTTLSGRAGKPSPSVRPQSLKKTVLKDKSEEVLSALSEESATTRVRASGGSSLRYGSNESSGQDSVSPEPLSEPLMPPPAIPQQQSKKSPGAAPPPPATSAAAAAASRASAAATPATLMRLKRAQHTQEPSGQFRGAAQLVSRESHDDVMEDIVLPEAANPLVRAQSRPSSSSRVQSAVGSPATSASVTPSIEPRSGSIVERAPGTSSVAPSPRTVAMPSPSGPVAKKPESRGGGISRKRQSLSSQMSPPLRPKISPSIKPLVRGDVGGSISSEASALFLASKSNYQHILDGTLLPGVSYPEALAENLSSKRTNHKLAEQGRRNRINNALKEIEALLPPEFTSQKTAGDKEKETSTSTPTPTSKGGSGGANGGGGGGGGGGSTQPISKASTVEMAIEYIKALKKELDETKRKLELAEARLNGDGSAGTRSSTTSTTTSTTAPTTTTKAEQEEDSLMKNNNNGGGGGGGGDDAVVGSLPIGIGNGNGDRNPSGESHESVTVAKASTMPGVDSGQQLGITAG